MVSVIVPVFRCEKYIKKCVRSILNQTYSDIEVILILDGEFDGSGDICKDFAHMDERVVLIEKENEGVSVARNIGINVAKGEWIVFVDSDDWLEKDFVECMVEIGEKSCADIAICNFFAEYTNKSILDSFFELPNHVFEMDEKEELVKNCLIHTGFGNKKCVTNVGVPWAKMYRTDFIRDNNLLFVPGLSRMQDTIFNLYAFSVADTIVFDNSYLYHYLKNYEASTIAYREKFNYTVEKLLDEIDEFNALYRINEFESIVSAKVILLIIELIKLQYAAKGCKKNLNRKIKEIKDILKNRQYQKALEEVDTKLLTNMQKFVKVLLMHNMILGVYLMCKIKMLIVENIESKNEKAMD